MDRTRRRSFVRVASLAGVLALVLGGMPGPASTAPACNWPMYGHDLGHSFAQTSSCSNIKARNVSTLVPRWFFNTHAPVSASPSVYDGVVYVGAYDGTFYALNADTGKKKWSFAVTDKNQTDYGPIVSSAAVDVIDGRKVVAFGGASTLYLLDANTGAKLASSCFDPRSNPAVQCKGSTDTIEIEASPSIVHMPSGGVRIVAGMDFNEDANVGRAGVIELRVDHVGSSWSLVPLWKFDPETLQTYTVDPLHSGGKGTGCGNVWSSPTVDVASGLIFFGVGNCDERPNPLEPGDGESIVAITLDAGTLVWRFMPRPADNDLDLDYGSSAQLLPGGRVGEAGKDGTYYAFDRQPGTASPQPLWTSHVTTASDVGGIIGSVSLGRVNTKPALFAPSAIPISTRVPGQSIQEGVQHPERLFALHAIDATTGAVLWNAPMPLPSYAATTYANHVVFLPDTFGFQMQAYNANLGIPMWAFPLGMAPSSAAAIVGSSIYFGGGTVGAGLPLDTTGGVWSFGLAGG
jgi:outer membrane protein assembly factor BamB